MHGPTTIENRKKSKLPENAVRMLGLAALLTWFGSMFLFEHYSYTRPTVENAAQGRVYLQNNHGYYTYLTAKEHYLLMLLMIAAGVLFVCGALIDRYRSR
jgi:hypothetical protein